MAFLFRLSAHSSLLRYLMGKDIRQRLPYDGEMLARYADSMASVYLSNIELMKRRCDLERTPCYFFLQPCRAITVRNKGLSGTEDIWILKTYEEILRRIGKYPYLHDLTGIFDKHEVKSIFLDDAHFRDEGHALVAAEIARIIVKNRKQSRPLVVNPNK